MLYILYGKDDFSLHQSLQEIKKEAGTPELLETNTTIVDGQQLTLSQLVSLCNTVPFLSERRLVIVENLLQRFEIKPGAKRDRPAEAEHKKKEVEEWQGLSSYIKQMPASTFLVLINGELSQDNPVLRDLVPVAEIRTFPELKGKKLRDWIQNHVAGNKSTIADRAVSLLIEAIGGDLWTMDKEIEKLLLYCSGRAIMENDVRQLVSQTREPNILYLVDAILERKVKVAHELLHRLLEEGMLPSHLLAMLARQLGFIVRAKELPRGLPREEAQKKLGLLKDYPFDKTLTQAKAYTLDRVREVYHKIVETDLAIKTGKYGEELALDLLIAELCQL